jgi:sorbitol-specific phosphotransferase system component IIBC
MKKVLLAVAAVSGAVAVTLLKRRPHGPETVESTANVWASAVGEAANKAADKVTGVAQTAASKADDAARRVADAASSLPPDHPISDKAADTVSKTAANVGAAVADAADATGETLDQAAKATSRTAAEVAASAARAAQATRSELEAQGTPELPVVEAAVVEAPADPEPAQH